ncbi:ATP-binding protein [Streptomyces sp. PSKA30]|uniref:ATP-binding protein n=1 Tax=Streptomyces sp. PSKA30 TaxID=2874597 RepID=UPI001CD121AD|nr:ATP-binding protein [Streptomyces sp. PSKA30]MBZ9644615.1 ATP-binding protein [Streptomyces sp. PSKA30]
MNPENVTLKCPTPPHHFTIRLSPTRRGARLARRLAVQQLDAWGWAYDTEVSDTVAHLVAELAANAVQHGRVRGRDFRMRLSVASESTAESKRTLRIEASDARVDHLPTAPDDCQRPCSDSESGRGLMLVSALADAWGCDTSDPVAKTVWAEVYLQDAAA